METSLIHADVFFFISAIGFIAVGVLLIAIMLFALLIVHDIREMVRKAREEEEEMLDDINKFRKQIKGSRDKVMSWLGSLFGLNLNASKKRRKK
ncbi:MAG: hypothetical protein Q8P52_01470 [bacterium]|nr:hypothetical protein [bacterium]